MLQRSGREKETFKETCATQTGDCPKPEPRERITHADGFGLGVQDSSKQQTVEVTKKVPISSIS